MSFSGKIDAAGGGSPALAWEPPDAALPREDGAVPRAEPRALTGLALLVAVVWILLRHFGGLESDARLYTLQALAYLDPANFGNDPFVRLNIQDRFTVFSPLYAAVIRPWGMEHAAALLTLAAHAAFFAASWLLARRFMSADRVLLGLGLLLALPGFYGASESLQVFENFITPRQPAEALVIAGLAMVLAQRPALAGLCLAGALVLHPLIALAGVVLWGCWLVPPIRQHRTLLLAAAGAMLVADLAFVFHAGLFARIDGDWLPVLRDRLGYLFPASWPMSAWGLGAVPLAVLVAGLLTSPQAPVRRLCAAGVVMAAGGVLFALVGADLLHLVRVTQLQPWRWLWLSGYLGVMLMPVVVPDCWRGGPLGRATVALLLAAWLGIDDARALPLAALACLCAAGAGRNVPLWFGASVLAGAMFLLAAGAMLAAWDFHLHLRQSPLDPFVRGRYAVWLEQLQLWCHRGTLPALLLWLAWWVYGRAGARGATALTAVVALGCALLLPFAWASWSLERYPPARIQAFDAWRRAIPEGTEVLWLNDTADTWFLLQRPAYWSLDQMAGLVFSRELAELTTRREARLVDVRSLLERPEEVTVLSPLPDAGAGLPDEGGAAVAGHDASQAEGGLAAVCRLPGLRFFVSQSRLAPTPYEPVVPRADRPDERLYLYRCGA